MRYPIGSPLALNCEPSLDPPDEFPVCEETRTNKFTDICAKCRKADEQEEEQDL